MLLVCTGAIYGSCSWSQLDSASLIKAAAPSPCSLHQAATALRNITNLVLVSIEGFKEELGLNCWKRCVSTAGDERWAGSKEGFRVDIESFWLEKTPLRSSPTIPHTAPCPWEPHRHQFNQREIYCNLSAPQFERNRAGLCLCQNVLLYPSHPAWPGCRCES